MKYLAIIMALILLSSIAFANCAPIDENTPLTEYGSCLVHYGAFGSQELMALLLMFVVIAIMLLIGVPSGVSFPVGTITMYTLYLMTGNDFLLFFTLIALIVSGIIVAGGVLKGISKRGGF